MSKRNTRRAWSHDMIQARLNRRGLVMGAVAGAPVSLTPVALAAGVRSKADGAEIDPTVDEPDGAAALVEETTTLRVLIVQNATVENYETNTFTQRLEEETNVHIERQTAPLESARRP